MNLAERRYRLLVRVSAGYDLAVTAPFATPWTFGLVLQLLNLISPMPKFEPEHALFVNLMGSIVSVWAALRIYKPDPLLGLFDSFGRVFFFTWQMYYGLMYHVTPVVWFIAAFEGLFMVLQLYGYWVWYKAQQPTESNCKVVNHFKEQ
jgi:hypothetical protein